MRLIKGRVRHPDAGTRLGAVGLSGDIFLWLPPAVLGAMILLELMFYSASRAAVADVARDWMERAATAGQPVEMLPERTFALMPLGARAVDVATTNGQDLVMHFSIATSEASLLGLARFVVGDTLAVRATLVRGATAEYVADAR